MASIRESDVLRRLEGLRLTAAGRGFDVEDRVIHKWCITDGPIGAVVMVYNSIGLRNLHLLQGNVEQGSRSGNADEFLSSLGLPLREAKRPPAEVSRALELGDGRGISYDLRDFTDFEVDVWKATLEIDRGQVKPYNWLAQRIGRPKAVRAVGTALGKNPIPILIPCHRVIKSDGSVGSYAFGSEYKTRLLCHEGMGVLRSSPEAGQAHVSLVSKMDLES